MHITGLQQGFSHVVFGEARSPSGDIEPDVFADCDEPQQAQCVRVVGPRSPDRETLKPTTSPSRRGGEFARFVIRSFIPGIRSMSWAASGAK